MSHTTGSSGMMRPNAAQRYSARLAQTRKKAHPNGWAFLKLRPLIVKSVPSTPRQRSLFIEDCRVLQRASQSPIHNRQARKISV